MFSESAMPLRFSANPILETGERYCVAYGLWPANA
jgi:hypothetical protein